MDPLTRTHAHSFQVLILNRAPIEVLDWVDRVTQWNIKRVIPAHLENNIQTDAKTFRRAFSFLEANGEPPGQPKPLEADLQALRDGEISLLASGALDPRPPKPGGELSRQQVLDATNYRCRKQICTPRGERSGRNLS